jgi:hypothetical protein
MWRLDKLGLNLEMLGLLMIDNGDFGRSFVRLGEFW